MLSFSVRAHRYCLDLSQGSQILRQNIDFLDDVRLGRSWKWSISWSFILLLLIVVVVILIFILWRIPATVIATLLLIIYKASPSMSMLVLLSSLVCWWSFTINILLSRVFLIIRITWTWWKEYRVFTLISVVFFCDFLQLSLLLFFTVCLVWIFVICHCSTFRRFFVTVAQLFNQITCKHFGFINLLHSEICLL